MPGAIVEDDIVPQRQKHKRIATLPTELYAAILSYNPEDAHVHSLVSWQFYGLSLSTLWNHVTVYYVAEGDDGEYNTNTNCGHKLRNGKIANLFLGHSERIRLSSGGRLRLHTLHDFLSFLRSSPHLRRHIHSLRLSARLYTAYSALSPPDIGEDLMEDVYASTAKLHTVVSIIHLLPRLANLQLSNFLLDGRSDGYGMSGAVSSMLTGYFEIGSLQIDVYGVSEANWDMTGVESAMEIFKPQQLHLFWDVPAHPWYASHPNCDKCADAAR